MLQTWILWINRVIAGLVVFFLIASAALAFTRPMEIDMPELTANKRQLPKNSFELPKNTYDTIGKNSLELKFAPITLQVPDLRNHLVYNGKNGRPDIQIDRTVLHFSFAINPAMTTAVQSGEKLYILYDRTRTPAQYIFSPNNGETCLWVIPTAQNQNEVLVHVHMKNENGELLQDASHAQFSLVEKEGMRVAGKPWEMGKWRVDGSLLARQKARWMGLDRFLERHGGIEFEELKNKHRIDFVGEEEEGYSVYVALNDCLIWCNEKWKVVPPGEESLNYPLMVVKKVDERLMSFELWDVGGKGKAILNLIKSSEPWTPQNIKDSFKFLGARTRSQFIFEIEGKRMLLSPQDWLLQTEEGWIKLETVKQIDDYVDRKIKGVLFVVDNVVKKADEQVLVGVMFNASRTEMQEIELVVQQGGIHAMDTKADGYEEDTSDEDEEEVLDEDEESPRRNIEKVEIRKSKT